MQQKQIDKCATNTHNEGNYRNMLLEAQTKKEVT